jgi:hypothetical protein
MEANSTIGIIGNVVAILTHEDGTQEVFTTKNIVTSAGDLHYAQRAVGQTPTVAFQTAPSGLRLGSGSTTPTKSDTTVTTFLTGTGHAIDATYPRTADPDAGNTGSGTTTCTWRYSYTTAEGNAIGIREGAIVNNTTTPTACLSHFLFPAAFTKTVSDTLVVYVNNLFLGA